jgi:hypothetical protein
MIAEREMKAISEALATPQWQIFIPWADEISSTLFKACIIAQQFTWPCPQEP